MRRFIEELGFRKATVKRDKILCYFSGQKCCQSEIRCLPLAQRPTIFGVGLSVSKKLGNTVINRIKRLIRHVLIKHQAFHLRPMILLSLLIRSGGTRLIRVRKNLVHVLKLAHVYQEGNIEKKLKLTGLLGAALLVLDGVEPLQWQLSRRVVRTLRVYFFCRSYPASCPLVEVSV